MLTDNLNSNQVKDRAGTAVVLDRRKSDGPKTFFRNTTVPSQPLEMTIGHIESGEGVKKRRRSVVRFDKTHLAADGVSYVTTSCYVVLDNPIGAIANNNVAADVLAHVHSFGATTGAATTVLFDGTGNGAVALLNGSL